MGITPGKYSTLEDIGIRFMHGYTACHVGNLAQVLWFRIESSIAQRSQCASMTYFWLELASGGVHAFRLSGLEVHPEALIPSLDAALNETTEGRDIADRMKSTWLFPPDFSIAQLKTAPIQPTRALIWKAIKSRIESMTHLNLLPPEHERTLESIIQSGWSGRHHTDEDFDATGLDEPICRSDGEEADFPQEILEFLADCHSFQASLDSDILKLFTLYADWFVGVDTVDNYNLIAAWTGNRRRNRLQSMHTFPWLLHKFGLRSVAGSTSLADPSNSPSSWDDILLGIDAGHPLLPALEIHYGVRKHTLRKARDLLSAYHPLETGSIQVFLWLLDGMKPDKRPASKTEINHLRHVVDWLRRWKLDTDREFVGDIARTLFADGVETARRRIARWCPSHNNEDPYGDTEDFVGDRIDHLGQDSSSGDAYGRFLKTWVEEAGLPAFFKASERWHRDMCSKPMPAIGDTHWAPRWPEPQAVGNLIAQELHTARMLHDEGQAMRHCIASHVHQCARGEAIVFSLRRPNGTRRSTLQLVPLGYGQLLIAEHRAFANGEPDDECRAAAQRLLDLVEGQTRHGEPR